MNRPLAAALCLAGAVLFTAPAPAQWASAAKPVRVPPGPSQTAGAQPSGNEAPPALLDKVRADLAKEQGVNAGAVKVIGSQFVNWPNGALGCPKRGVMYTQAIVPGYRIELEAGGRRFTYHAAARGGFKRCDNRIGALPLDSAK
jgi:hypothetical protein